MKENEELDRAKLMPNIKTTEYIYTDQGFLSGKRDQYICVDPEGLFKVDDVKHISEVDSVKHYANPLKGLPTRVGIDRVKWRSSLKGRKWE